MPAEADVWNYRPLSAVKLPATLNKERHTGVFNQWQDVFRATTLSAARKLRGT